MSDSGVRPVTTNQDGLYKKLEETVRRYATTAYLRPIADHTRQAFESARQFIQDFYKKQGVGSASLGVILDSGCGTGESTLHLARKFPNMPVIGIDKSAMRLNKAGNEHQLEKVTDAAPEQMQDLSNAFWVRAELLDFWRLALDEVNAGRWSIAYHALYYPNPWPKESEATRRFHLHPIFPTLLKLGQITELRTNWEIYAREFAEASHIVSAGKIACEQFSPERPETAFERKYKENGQTLWRVTVLK